jgi:hypothetical protein
MADGAQQGGVAQGGLEPYHRTKAGKHWVKLVSHPYRSPYQAVPGVPGALIVGELILLRQSTSEDRWLRVAARKSFRKF